MKLKINFIIIKAVLTISILIKVFSTYGQTELNCEKILNQEMSILRDSFQNIEKNISKDISILLECGKLDSIDKILLSPPLLSVLMMQYKNESKYTYKKILEYYNDFKKTTMYFEIKDYWTKINNNQILIENEIENKELIEKEIYKFDLFINLEESFLKSKNNNKDILLYFTGNYSINSKNIEKKILVEDTIKNLLRLYNTFLVSVDDTTKLNKHECYYSKIFKTEILTIGERNSEMQTKNFNTNTQPFFVILNKDGKFLRSIQYTNELEEFINFLKQ